MSPLFAWKSNPRQPGCCFHFHTEVLMKSIILGAEPRKSTAYPSTTVAAPFLPGVSLNRLKWKPDPLIFSVISVAVKTNTVKSVTYAHRRPAVYAPYKLTRPFPVFYNFCLCLLIHHYFKELISSISVHLVFFKSKTREFNFV